MRKILLMVLPHILFKHDSQIIIIYVTMITKLTSITNNLKRFVILLVLYVFWVMNTTHITLLGIT